MNVFGALALKENASYTVLREGYGRRASGECYDWERKNKHRMFFNLEQDGRDVPIREKIAACSSFYELARKARFRRRADFASMEI